MSDVGAGRDVEYEKMKMLQQHGQIKLNVLGCEIRLREIENDRRRTQENISASQKALADLEQKIAEMDSPVGEKKPEG